MVTKRTRTFINNVPANIKGFTLLEVMITVAIIGILAAVTYPSYNEYIWRSHRTEAQQELIRLANLQEQLFVDQRTYTSNMSDLGVPVSEGGYQIPRHSDKKLYTITGTKDGRTFILSAKAQGVQVKDTGCTTLTINESGLKTPTTGCWE